MDDNFLRNKMRSTSSAVNISIAFPSPFLIKPSKRCSVPINSCPKRSAYSLLKVITSLTFGEKLELLNPVDPIFIESSETPNLRLTRQAEKALIFYVIK